MQTNGKVCLDCGFWVERDGYEDDFDQNDEKKPSCKSCMGTRDNQRKLETMERAYNSGDTTVDLCECGNYYMTERYVKSKWEIYDNCIECRGING